MSMELNCPVCRAINAFSETQAGVMGKCGKCGTPMYVPRREELPELSYALSPAQGNRGWLIGAIVAAGLCVVLGAGVGAFFLFWPGKQDPGPGPIDPIANVGGTFGTSLNVKLNGAGGLIQEGRFKGSKDGNMFKFKAAVTGTMMVQFDADGNSLDSRLHAYDGAEKEIAKNDNDADKRVSQVLFPVTAGQDYFLKSLAVDDKAAGAYKLTFATITNVGNDFNTALEVKLSRTGYGAPQTWRLEPAGDEDFFRFVAPLTGSMTIEVRNAPGSSLDSVLAAYDAGKIYLRDATNFDVNLPRTMQLSVQAGRPYYVKVSAFKNAFPERKTGAYQLSFRMDKSTPDDHGNDFDSATEIFLALDGSAFQTGRIDPVGDVDFFRFKAATTANLNVEMNPEFPGGLSCALIAYGGNRVQIQQDDFGGASFLNFKVQAGQTYFIRAAASTKGFGPQTGGYTLKLRCEKAVAPVVDDYGNDFDTAHEIFLNLDGSAKITGRIDYVGDIDCFRFKAKIDGTMFVDMRPFLAGPLDCRLSAYDDTRLFLANQDVGFSAHLQFTVKAGKTYYLKAEGTTAGFAQIGAKTGNYDLDLRSEKKIDLGNAFTNAEDIKLGADGVFIKLGRIQALGGAVFYRFQAPDAGPVTIEMAPPPGTYLVTRLIIYDENQQVIKDEDRDSANLAQFTAQAGKTYYLQAAGSKRQFVQLIDKTGDYLLTLRTGKALKDDFGNDFQSAHGLTLSEEGLAVQNGRIEILGDVDMFSFTAPVTGTVLVELRPELKSRLDTDLFVYDQDKLLIKSDDKGYWSVVQFNAVEGKTYYLKAAGTNQFTSLPINKVGNYVLTVRTGKSLADDYGNTFDTAHELKLSPQGAATIKGRIDILGDEDFFRFTPTVAGVLTVNMRPEMNGILFTRVTVYNADKQTVLKLNAQAFDQTWRFNVESDQTYYIKAAASTDNFAYPSNKVGGYVIEVKKAP